MLIRMSKQFHHSATAEGVRFALTHLTVTVCLLLTACSKQPVQGLQITGASPIRHGQLLETQVVSGTAERCIIRTKLPEQRLPGLWLDDRNSALRAALERAAICCADPQLTLVEDWIVGFSAYEATFHCD